MKTICLSHFLNDDTPGFAGQKAFHWKHINQISAGKSSNSQEWTLSNHVGTHIDLPAHFDDEGKRLKDFEVDFWIYERPYLLEHSANKSEVLELIPRLEQIPNDCDFLIIKTGFQKLRGQESYWSENPGLSPEMADWLRTHRPKVRCIGFDFISITAFQKRELGRKAHRHFLHREGNGNPICAIEDMNLQQLKESPKKIIVAPLWVEFADGAPVTVFALV